MTATFLRSLPPDGAARDAVVLGAIYTGHLDPPTWVRLRMGRVEIEVSADYLTIAGERVPMAAAVAQAAVDSLDALLPTPAIVDAIEAQAVIVPAPTWSPPPGQSRGAQTSSAIFAWCEEETRARFAARGIGPGELVAGHRKDVVISDYMPPGTVVIVGARWPDGRRIQNLLPRRDPKTGEIHAANKHEDGYEDYLHGVRAARRRCWLDGVETTLDAVLTGPHAALLGGPVARLRYPMPTTASTTPTTPATARPLLRRGARGEAVLDLQTRLVARGYSIARDSLFGSGTEGAVLDFQEERGLEVDGVVGPKTWGALLGTAVTTSAPAPAASVEPIPDDVWNIPPILTETQLVAKYGKIEWVAAPHPNEPRMVRVTNGWNKGNLVSVVVPELVGIKGAPPGGKVLCHRLFGPKLIAAFADIAREGKLHYIRTWDGLLNQRTMTGQPDKLSRHAYGIGFDINAHWNPFKGPAARGEGSILPLVPIFRRHGITWLGDYDPMHLEDMA